MIQFGNEHATMVEAQSIARSVGFRPHARKTSTVKGRSTINLPADSTSAEENNTTWQQPMPVPLSQPKPEGIGDTATTRQPTWAPAQR